MAFEYGIVGLLGITFLILYLGNTVDPAHKLVKFICYILSSWFIYATMGILRTYIATCDATCTEGATGATLDILMYATGLFAFAVTLYAAWYIFFIGLKSMMGQHDEDV